MLGGCGAAVLASTFPTVGIGLLGVSLAFGLTVLTMAYAVGQVSGGHFNPAVTVGLWAGRRFAGRDVPAYVGTQVLAAVTGALVLFLIAQGQPTFEAGRGFAANGYGEHSRVASAWRRASSPTGGHAGRGHFPVPRGEAGRARRGRRRAGRVRSAVSLSP